MSHPRTIGGSRIMEAEARNCTTCVGNAKKASRIGCRTSTLIIPFWFSLTVDEVDVLRKSDSTAVGGSSAVTATRTAERATSLNASCFMHTVSTPSIKKMVTTNTGSRRANSIVAWPLLLWRFIRTTQNVAENGVKEGSNFSCSASCSSPCDDESGNDSCNK